jgi:hypothetical protein
MGLTATAQRLSGWTPIAVEWDGARPAIRWCFTDGLQFTEPSFDETIERCLRDPFRLLFWRETEIDALAELALASPGLEPAGFIFHMSRCGSTLVSQMLAGMRTALVISEAGPIDSMLRAVPQSAQAGGDSVERLRWIVSALGQPRDAAHTHLVVKLDAWSILQLPLIRRAFPDSACVFVYRDPVEVVVSHLGHRGYHMIPGALPPEWFGLSLREAQLATPEQYFATVLARLCESALAGTREGQLTLVGYESLPDAVSATIAPLFGIDVGPAERAAFAAAASRDAKNPALAFVPDAADKQRRATGAMRAVVETRVGPVYRALDALRQAQS